MTHIRFVLSFILLFSFKAALFAGEGMYPINTIDKVNLKKFGMKMDQKDIYNPNGQGLINAVVQIGGCTGSFVSDQGLIITNHHCAFGGLEPYSSPENNLLEKGYLAQNKEKELPFKGLTCRILVSHKDISEEVLKGTDKIADAMERRGAIAKNIQTVKQAEHLKAPELMLDVSEMLPGKSYMLFRYFLIKDLRIVYIPARNIGEFGGETDNWEWPRHNGDFSFVRAYVSPDGKGTEYSASNVPYHPKEYLNINAKGLQENDFVFIVGYPGRTFRHQPAEFLKYQQEYQLPFISELYGWEINTIKNLGAQDEKFMLRNEPKIKQLANVMKNYQGKLKTIRKIDLYATKKKSEQDILNKLSADRKGEFQAILKRTDSIYSVIEKDGRKQMWYYNLLSENKALNIAQEIINYDRQYRRSKESEVGKLREDLIKRLRYNYQNFYIKYDSTFLWKMFSDASKYDGSDRVPAVESQFNTLKNKKFNSWLAKAYKKSKILDSSYLYKLINSSPKKLASLSDPFVVLVNKLLPDYYKVDSVQTACRAQLDVLLPRYVDLRMEAQGQDFIPDANRTLRLTYGNIRGYSPADGVYCFPFTTASGMLEKNGTAPDYKVNEDIIALMKKNGFGKFKLKNKDDLPLCMLYDTDTTGGNSGSPIMNENGQLVGVNFDRCFEATVNDYAWNESYSRSIGVDIRFVLWVTSQVAGADYLLKEMYIEQD